MRKKAEHYMLTGIPSGKVKSGVYGRQQVSLLTGMKTLPKI